MNIDLTPLVEAAARAAYDHQLKQTAETTQIDIALYADWDGIGPVAQLGWRNGVLPIVEAAVRAIPDPLAEVSNIVFDIETPPDVAIDYLRRILS